MSERMKMNLRRNDITKGEREKVHSLLHVFVIQGTVIGKTIMHFFLFFSAETKVEHLVLFAPSISPSASKVKK